jgi:hypothetical protein
MDSTTADLAFFTNYDLKQRDPHADATRKHAGFPKIDTLFQIENRFRVGATVACGRRMVVCNIRKPTFNMWHFGGYI